MARDIKIYIPSIVLALLCAAAYLMHLSWGIGDAMPRWHALLYHFSHANFFHLACNLYVLYFLRPRWSTLAVSYILASLVGLMPFVWCDLPTVGVSAILFAVIGRIYAEHRINPLPLLAINAALALLPMVNGMIHCVSLLTAYAIWKTADYLRKSPCW